MVYDPSNREPLIRARAIDVDNLIVQGDITLVGGGNLKTSAGGVIEIPAGSILTVDGTVNLTGTAALAAVAVAGAATVGTTLGVTGATTLASVGVTGAATVGATLGVTGAATLGQVNLAGGVRGDHLLHATDGMSPVGYIYYTGVTVDTETVTIDGRVYEFDTGGVIGGDVLVDISGGGSAAQSAAALELAINTDALRTVDAVVDTAANGVLLVGLSTAAAPTLATTCANGVVSAATFGGDAVGAARQLYATSHVISAADQTRLAIANGAIAVAGFPTTVPPVVMGITVLDTNGLPVSGLTTTLFTLEQPNANLWILVATDTGAVGELTAGFTVNVMAVL